MDTMLRKQAALDGIAVNGHRWKHQIRLSHLTHKMGEMDESTPDAEVEALTKQIIVRVRAFLAGRPTLKDAMESQVDELEAAADCGIEEVRFAMNNLYDDFDFHRICVL